MLLKPIALSLSLLPLVATAAVAQSAAPGWSTQLSFGLGRTSNINNGFATTLDGLQELPFAYELQSSDKSLSASMIELGLATSRTLAETGSARTDLRLSAYQRRVTLSEDGTRVKGSDFNLSSLTAGIGQSWTLGGGGLVLGTEAALGHVFLGGDSLYSNLNVGGSVRYSFTPYMTAQFRAMREAQIGYDGRADAHAWRGSAGVTTELAQGQTLSAAYNYAEGSSSEDYLDYADHEIAVNLGLAQPVLGASVDFGLSASRKHYARNEVTSGDRDDDTLQGDVSLRFENANIAGFVPNVTLSTRRSDSNIKTYRAIDYGLQMGLSSQF